MATCNEVQFVQTQHQGAKSHKHATYGHTDHLRPLRSSRHSYSILEFFVSTAFHTLSLLHFPLPHFQRPRHRHTDVMSFVVVRCRWNRRIVMDWFWVNYNYSMPLRDILTAAVCDPVEIFVKIDAISVATVWRFLNQWRGAWDTSRRSIGSWTRDYCLSVTHQHCCVHFSCVFTVLYICIHDSKCSAETLQQTWQGSCSDGVV